MPTADEALIQPGLPPSEAALRQELLERAAIAAMQGLLSNPVSAGAQAKPIAEHAVEFATALVDLLRPRP